ncbi:PAP2 family protein [Sandaracinus amylolyticus]|uniref:PAP2 family protein n=1 Tax=Sandaracinus amylolyticus TaxID=927083 RepID=A0A0F6YMD9_9BACT|nr:PAP2 family protein [Sandaracinus amylolyticus]
MLVSIVVLSSFPAHALADDAAALPSVAESTPLPSEPELSRPPMRDLDPVEAVVSGVISAAVVGATFLPSPTRETPQWRGGIVFDDPVRDALHLRAPEDRRLASTLSDAIVGTLVVAPILVDAALMAGFVRGDPELMTRMLLMNLQAHAISFGLTTIFKKVVGRERPNARACREDPERQSSDPLCESPPEHTASFFSGHASLAFTSAALMCVQHAEIGLFGQEGDAVMCATGLALATTVGLLRIAADKHYASDVIVGALVGGLTGWLVPWLFHFDVADTVGIDGASATVAPMIDERQIGMQLFGVF